jgi:hypothetical protein
MTKTPASLPPLTPPPQPLADRPADILEQYKAYLEDLGNIGTRYTTSNAFYMSVITALLGILALTKKGASYAELRTVLGLTVPAFAIMLCWVWNRTVDFYKALFKVKFDMLRELERLGGLHNVFEREDIAFHPRPWLLQNERRIPVFLALPFVVILIDRLWTLLPHCP